MHGKRYLEESGSCGSTLPAKMPANEGNIHSESDSQWNQFKDEFQCQLVSSEREMHQVKFQKLQEDLLVAVLGMVGADQQEAKSPVQQQSSKTGQYGPIARSELLDIRTDSDLMPAVPCTSHQTVPPHPRAIPGQQHHGILHSNKYERISEVELDLVLEAIEEESEHSREGSHSPATITSTE